MDLIGTAISYIVVISSIIFILGLIYFSLGFNLDPIESLKVTADNQGYWLISRRGKVFPFGAATTASLDRAVEVISSRKQTKIAIFDGSGHIFTPVDWEPIPNDLPHDKLNARIAYCLITPSGKGFWLVAQDGGVFCIGDAPFWGSAGLYPRDLGISWSNPWSPRKWGVHRTVAIPMNYRGNVLDKPKPPRSAKSAALSVQP